MFALTDTNNRAGNEDNYFLGEFGDNRRLAIICDGMGGLTQSDQASTMVIRNLVEGIASGRVSPDDYHGISQILRETHQALSTTGSGTTVAYAVTEGTQLTVYSLGDSRVYVSKGNHSIPVQLTKDHTEFNLRVGKGQEIPEHLISQMKNTLTKAIGPGRFHMPDVFTYECEPGDGVLLATDGFWHTLELTSQPLSVSEETLRGIIHDAVEIYGERDNITAIGFVI